MQADRIFAYNFGSALPLAPAERIERTITAPTRR